METPRGEKFQKVRMREAIEKRGGVRKSFSTGGSKEKGAPNYRRC